MQSFKAEQHEKDTDTRNMANLCIMCGKCCLAIATIYKPEQLIEMAKKGEKEAIVFVEFFKKYKNIAEARKVVPDQVKQVLKNKNLPQNLEGDEVQFYYCDKITEDKKCTIHKDRPLCCRMAPIDGWSLMPPKCGYTGWLFNEQERIKAHIRSVKETIYEIETLEGPDAFVDEMNVSLKELKEQVEYRIKPFLQYGAANW